MPRLQYLVEVMNKRIRKFGALFYPALEDRHWYTDSFNYDYIDSLGLGAKEFERDSRWDKDCDPSVPLNISHDWGAFNCITIDQETRDEIRVINAMHVYHPQIIDDLAKRFCKYYQHHKKKIVYQWGDKSGNNKVGNAKKNNFEQFAQVLKTNGWTVIRKTIGDIEHMERHRFITKLHREEDPALPKVRHNANNCKDLRISLESAGMNADAKKDKSGENNPRVEPQHATHYSDAYDYRLYHGLIKRSRLSSMPGANSIAV